MADPLTREFDALEVGEGFRSQGRTIAEADLVSFAALSGDRHPLHTDAEWAAESEFSGRIAHGTMLLAYCVGLVPFDPEWVLALRGFERVAFKRPVRIGDTIRVEGELESKRELDAASGLTVFSWRILNQRDDAVATARAKVVWRRQPRPAAAEPQEVFL